MFLNEDFLHKLAIDSALEFQVPKGLDGWRSKARIPQMRINSIANLTLPYSQDNVCVSKEFVNPEYIFRDRIRTGLAEFFVFPINWLEK